MIKTINLKKDYTFHYNFFVKSRINLLGFSVKKKDYDEFIKGKMELIIFDKTVEEVDLLFLTKINNNIINNDEIYIHHHSHNNLFKRPSYLGIINKSSNFKLILKFNEEKNFTVQFHYIISNIGNKIDRFYYMDYYNSIYPIVKSPSINKINLQLIPKLKGFLIDYHPEIKEIIIISNNQKVIFRNVCIMFSKINDYLFIDINNTLLDFLDIDSRNTIEIIVNNNILHINIYPIYNQPIIYQNDMVFPYY